MSKRKKPEVTQFELDLSISIGQEMRGEVKATTPEQITVRRRRAGRPVQEVHKQPVTLRLDPEVLARWRASGKGWQTRAAKALALAAPL